MTHRDIKPDNIMITLEDPMADEFKLILIDFNVVYKGLTGMKSVTGIAEWSAPETRA